MFASIRRRRFALASLVVLALAVSFGIYALRYDLRSYALLTRFLHPDASGPLLWMETRPISVQDVTVAAAGGTVRARLYQPYNTPHVPGIVLVHGMNRFGINDPRLMNFARAAAGTGFAVLTPQLASLSDYYADAESINVIGDSAEWLQQRFATGPVAAIGISVGGGLSLLAASEPRFASDFRVLAALGAHDDLARVSRFLATGEVELPDGRSNPYGADEYGVTLLVYGNLSQFFSPQDWQPAGDALRDVLAGKAQYVNQELEQLTPEGRATIEEVLSNQVAPLRPQLLESIRKDIPQLAAVSPHGRLANLRAPVYLLHGSEDHIIPTTEALWLQKEIPPQNLREVLLTPAFTHADLDLSAGLWEKARLTLFLADVLRAAD